MSHLEGYLEKKGAKGVMKGYKRRWFHVNGHILIYSSGPKDRALGSIDLSTVLSVKRVKSQKMFDFEVETKSRCYHLAAANEVELDRWVDGLNTIIKNPKGSLVGSPVKPSMGTRDRPITTVIGSRGNNRAEMGMGRSTTISNTSKSAPTNLAKDVEALRQEVMDRKAKYEEIIRLYEADQQSTPDEGDSISVATEDELSDDKGDEDQIEILQRRVTELELEVDVLRSRRGSRVIPEQFEHVYKSSSDRSKDRLSVLLRSPPTQGSRSSGVRLADARRLSHITQPTEEASVPVLQTQMRGLQAENEELRKLVEDMELEKRENSEKLLEKESMLNSMFSQLCNAHMELTMIHQRVVQRYQTVTNEQVVETINVDDP